MSTDRLPSATGSVRRAAAGGTSITARLWRAARRAPVTAGFLTVLWVIGLSTSSIRNGPGQSLLNRMGAGLPSIDRLRLFSLLTSAFWSGGLVPYIAASMLIGGVGVLAERRWGSARLVWVALSIQTLGALIGLLVVHLMRQASNGWASAQATTMVVGPWPMAVGLLLAYSGTVAPLWRRRIRLGTVTVTGGLLLYTGQLSGVFAACAGAVGVLLGSLVLAGAPHPRTPRSSRRETRTTVAVLVLASAVGPLLVALDQHATGPFAVLRYLFVTPRVAPSDLAAICADPSRAVRCAQLSRQLQFHGLGPTTLSLLPSLLTILFAYGLWKGRRFAWWGAVVVHGVLAGLGLAMLITLLNQRRSPDFLGLPMHDPAAVGPSTALVLPMILLLILLGTHRAFDVPAPPGTYVRVARLLGMTVATLFAVYLVAGLLLAKQFAPAPSIGALVADFPRRLAPPGYLGLVPLNFLPTTAATTVLFEWTGVALWGIAIGAVLRSFTATRLEHRSRDAADSRAILQQHGRSGLSYLTMWQGNSYWFTPSHTTFIAYRVISGVAITTGNPIGPPADEQSAISGFAEYCSERGWICCFYSVSDAVRTGAVAAGWHSVQVAEEAVLPLGTLAYTGRKFQDLRTATSRAAREGIRADWISFGDAPWPIVDQIMTISAEWAATKGLPEMGFTLGGLDEVDDPSVRCLIAIDGAGTVHGITSWLPVYRGGATIGWTLDYMRRRSTGFNGVMEFLISTAALQFQREGAEFVSLSGAPLARTAPAASASAAHPSSAAPTRLDRLLERTGHGLEPVYGFHSLLAFKAKFQPVYQPIHLIYQDAVALPRIGNAISRAYLPHLSGRDLLRLARTLWPRGTKMSTGACSAAAGTTRLLERQ